VRTVAGLGWPTEESADPSDLGWPSTSPQVPLSTKRPEAVSRETDPVPGGGHRGEPADERHPEAPPDGSTDTDGDAGRDERYGRAAAAATPAEASGQERRPAAASASAPVVEPSAEGQGATLPAGPAAPLEARPPEAGEALEVRETDSAQQPPDGGAGTPQAAAASAPSSLETGSAAQPAETGSAPQPPEATGIDGDGGTSTANQASSQGGDTAHTAVSRETTSTTHKQRETMPNVDGLPDTATQGADQARFGPTLAPKPTPMTAAEIAADSGTGYSDPTTPLASATHTDLRTAGQHNRTLPRPDEPRVLVIANQKGGVGKTTTTVNMAAGLAQHGLRSLIIDLDPQGNASTALGIDHSAGTPGVYEVMADGTPMKEVVRECPDVPNLYGVPATIDLAGAEIELVSLVARESRLRKALDAYLTSLQDSDERFDYVFIDCPPSLGLLTINALVAGREMLIPIQCEYYALEGVTQLLRNVDMVRAHLNPELQVSTIVLTMYDGRTRLAAGVADEVRQHFGDVVLRTAIPRSVRISEAPSYGQTVMTYDPTSSGALSYLEAARELATHPASQTEEQ
jgi:chromosome partitioning protein